MIKKVTIENITVYASQKDVCTIEVEKYEDQEDQGTYSNLTRDQVVELTIQLMRIYKNMED